MARKLVVEVVLDADAYARSLLKANKATAGFARDVERFGRGTAVATLGIRGLGRAAGFASGYFIGGYGLATAVKGAFTEMQNMQAVNAQTAAALRSTGGVAGVTAQHVDELAKSMLAKTGIDDEATKSAENMLLTFTNVRNVVGQNNDIFDQATKAVADLATRFNKGAVPSMDQLQQAAVQVGKALQDPTKGITALRRVGVAFTRDQQKQIQTLARSGHVMEAQKIILRELAREFGGSAKAAGDSFGGSMAKLRENVRNLGGTFAQTLAPQIQKIVDKLNRWLSNEKNQKKIQDDFTEVVNDGAKALEFFATALRDIKKAWDLLPDFGKDKGLWDYLKKLSSIGPQIPLGPSLLDLAGGKGGRATVLPTTATGLLQGLVGRPGYGLVPSSMHPLPGGAKPPGGVTAAIRAGITAAQRNQWFDARIARELDRVQDLSLKKQLERLKAVYAEVKARLADTHDVTRRLTLQDKMVGILRQERDVQSQITDQIKQQTQALKDRADAIKSAVISRLQAQQQRREDKAALADAKDALRIAKLGGGPVGIREAARAVTAAKTAVQVGNLEAEPATLTKGGRFALGNIVTVNVNGITDPQKVAKVVVAEIRRAGTHDALQSRGAKPGVGGSQR